MDEALYRKEHTCGANPLRTYDIIAPDGSVVASRVDYRDANRLLEHLNRPREGTG